MKHGVYIHIPFCEQHCYYCAFTVSVAGADAYAPYQRQLIREIELSEFRQPPSTVYFGGGTPSIVPAASIGEILSRLGGIPEEVTIEANPGTLSFEKVRAYREAGVTRLSLGAQSLADEDLVRAGRLHQARDVIADFGLLRDAGFHNISLDLIAGLPGQRFETWCDNLERVLALRPEHISLYMLDVEERSAWGKQLPQPVADEDFARFYSEAERGLEAAGYHHYEISNWARPGRESRHNQGYWNGTVYRGFGVSAHSYDGRRRYWNTASLTEYAARIDGNLLPVAGEEILTTTMRLEEGLMLGLRQACGLDVQALVSELHVAFPPQWLERVQQVQKAGYIDFDGRVLRLTPAGRLIASTITEELLWPHPSSTFEATP